MCLEMRKYSHCLLYFMIVWFGFSAMVSVDFHQIGHGSNSCYGLNGILCRESKQTSACILLYIQYI